jgi:hypothetical protein
MINNNNNSTNISFNINPLSSSSINSTQQLSYVHLQPFRVSSSVINLKEKFLHSTNLTDTYERLNLLKGQNNLLSATDNYQSLERNLITKFLNITSTKVLEQMWKASQFCDLLLIVQGSEYLAHRFVLAGNSHKFK